MLALAGDLGAGKTHLVKGLAAGLGVESEVTSPTFTLIHEYTGGKLPLYHIDLYRLETQREIDTLGLDEIFDHAHLVLVEWGEKLGARKPLPRTEIHISYAGDGRLIELVEYLEKSDATGTRTT